MSVARHILVAAFVCWAAATVHAQASPKDGELKLFSLVNQERQSAGLAKLQWDDHLAESARAHDQALARYRQLSHQFPGEPALGERVGVTSLRFDATAENVASAPTVEAGHEALMKSPPHRANILNAQYNAMGIAILERDGTLYITQNFAHVLPVYSAAQFSDAVISAFRQIRSAKGLVPLKVVADSSLQQAACSVQSDPDKLIATLPGAVDLELFTSSVPEKLPAHMQAAAANATLRRMNIGVCFKPGKEHGFSSFEVVVAFFTRP